jgi:macrolide transport system ATP-binding/permease protein
MSSPILSLIGIHKSYSLRRVLDDVTVHLHPGDRLGLVGANGVGKSTLLRIAAGQEAPDSGSLRAAPDLRIGWQPQMWSLPGTLADALAEAAAPVSAAEATMRALETAMADGAHDSDTLARYGDALEAFERLDGYTFDARLESALTGLGVAHLDRARPFESLSGGEKSRVGLALLLLRAPDVLLLDEPTNHLDRAALDWLESAIAAHRGAALMVSHDRAFLNRTATAIVEIDEHTRQAARYTGDYDSYRRTRAAARQAWVVRYQREREEIHALREQIAATARRNDHYRPSTDNDKYLRNFRIANHEETVSKRVRDAETRLAHIMDDPTPKPPDDLTFSAEFDLAKIGGRALITLNGVNKSYGDRALWRDLDLVVRAGTRIVLVGENGSGKSTLLRMLAGIDTPDSGTVARSSAAVIGYLEQEWSARDGDRTLFEVLTDGADPQAARLIRTIAIGQGLFRNDDFEQPIARLSRGQQRKADLARILYGRANVLLLDEPTNDFSLDVVEGIETALEGYRGAIIAASHDRRFVERFAAAGGEVWQVGAQTGQFA